MQELFKLMLIMITNSHFYIISIITMIFPGTLKPAVNPVESPTVQNAETVSNSSPKPTPVESLYCIVPISQ